MNDSKKKIILLFLFGFFWVPIYSCPDSSHIQFLNTLLDEQEFDLLLYQTRIDKLKQTKCSSNYSLDLLSAKAYYHTGNFLELRSTLKPYLDTSRISRNYYFMSYLIDYDKHEGLDSINITLNKHADQFSPIEKAAYHGTHFYLSGNLPKAKALFAGSNIFSGGIPHKLFEEKFERGLKSPFLGATLSLIPGLGYCYARDCGTGVFSAVVVGIFYSVGAYYANFDSPTRSFFFLGMGGVFHISNIYGGYKAVKIKNRALILEFLESFHNVLFSF